MNRKAETPPVAVTEPAPPPREPPSPSRFNRRNLLKVVAGTAIAGEAAAVAYPLVTGGSVSDQGAKHAGDRYAEAQRHNIERTLINSRSDVGGRSLGRWIVLLPTKMGGGTYALDLNTNRVLARSGIGTTATTTRSRTTCARSRAPTRTTLRVRQQHAGRQELADLRHSDTASRTRRPASTSTASAMTARRCSLWRTCRRPPASGSASMSRSTPRTRSPISSPMGRRTSPPASTATPRA